jgi:hypothetical protein
MTNQTNTLKSTAPVVLFVLAAFLIVQALSCRKEASYAKPTPLGEKIACDFGISEDAFALAARQPHPLKGKGGGKPPKDTTTPPPTDTATNPQPVYGAVIFVDTDGHTVTGTSWNLSGPLACAPSGLDAEGNRWVVERIRADYAEFPVTVTADSTVYLAAPAGARMRVIITTSWEWYGMAGGVAYISSFTWGTESGCFVFSSLLSYNLKNIADASSHEAGHTLGLRHQARYEAGVKVEEYNSSLAADGKGHLMGYPYPHTSGWQVGFNPYGTVQDDRAIISATLRPLSGTAYITREELTETMKGMR